VVELEQLDRPVLELAVVRELESTTLAVAGFVAARRVRFAALNCRSRSALITKSRPGSSESVSGRSHFVSALGLTVLPKSAPRWP